MLLSHLHLRVPPPHFYFLLFFAHLNYLVDVSVLPREKDAAVGGAHHLAHDDAVRRHPVVSRTDRQVVVLRCARGQPVFPKKAYRPTDRPPTNATIHSFNPPPPTHTLTNPTRPTTKPPYYIYFLSPNAPEGCAADLDAALGGAVREPERKELDGRGRAHHDQVLGGLGWKMVARSISV
jgi:hypothetical protein